jgi:hypothetical protein
MDAKMREMESTIEDLKKNTRKSTINLHPTLAHLQDGLE